MRTNYRRNLALLGAGLLPSLAGGCVLAVGLGYPLALLSAAVTAFFAAWAVKREMARPMVKISAGVKSFIAADYKLDCVIPKSGWAEADDTISALNKLMLELSAYRAFHLNQLVEEKAKAQALIETIADGVLLVDDRGQVICSNQLALKVLGLAKPGAALVLPGAIPVEAFRSAISGILTSKDNLLRTEISFENTSEDYAVTKNYRLISRQFNLATMKFPGRVIVIRDVTVEKEIESARETFFHMITHDMRAPLTSIQGYTHLLTKNVIPSPESDKCLQAILRSSTRLNGMIEDILNTIRLERGEMKLNLTSIDPGALCARVFELHDPLAARKNIKFSVIPPASKLELHGDIILLERVITNLIGNSLKFTPAGGIVTLACRETSGEAVFVVNDTGPGIPLERQKDIFDKYSQLDEHKFMGFGLGLAMCKMAVELHKGRIWVESEPGKGSKFIVAVPLG